MKLLIAFIQKDDAPKLLDRLREAKVSVTSLESAGGFLRQRNTTILTAMKDDDVDRVVKIISEVCRARTERVDTLFTTGDIGSVGLPTSTDIPVGGATILILSVESVRKI